MQVMIIRRSETILEVEEVMLMFVFVIFLVSVAIINADFPLKNQ